ncbi:MULTISPECIES: cache domain-containing protein [unclassified Polaromonas]|uniref:cache domain-containing protein n=1 Tax=unclassified Polaromonas TaxID=2638319 RepID=UPI0018C8F409|nr:MULTISPECIES: cache domain-containing protein [unclassified Polaromonas]MBG6070769.1 two-component system NarL family sensor kinase [Polaromonas sp. CG_9.7]MBG6112922.1 two-component system NarL family sensor kinase [Polaromonas sp. CG_9.2]MDH6186396.1 two-component system NarL family sensor kinase [Polaromonas sp. CG_23.6]
MQLRLKIFLLSIVPMSIALGSVILTVHNQTVKLAKQERDLVESTYLASREAELRANVKLAQSAIAPLLKDAANPLSQAEAIAILSRLEYGKDGYFFVYDMNGKNVMHPRQPELVGQNLWSMKDPFGDFPIQKLLESTRNGGGIVRYYWEKPSSKQVAFKLGYVEPVQSWDWMLGTGLYLDDIEQALQGIDAQAQANIRETEIRMYAIAVISIILMGMAGLALNISDNKESGAKLRYLAQRVVQSQEEERLRVARELHDGIVQVLVSSKFFLETAQLQLENRLTAANQASEDIDVSNVARSGAAAKGTLADLQIMGPLKRGLERLSEALLEVRRISHGLRPALLDDFGLGPAIEVLANEVQEQCSMKIVFSTHGKPCAIPMNQSTSLFRISQEALTNAKLHSGAANVRVKLVYHRHQISLSIKDDGKGFNLREIQTDQRSGIGLRNMRERMEGLGGALKIYADDDGTEVQAWLDTASADR